jgi:hypothetical protein
VCGNFYRDGRKQTLALRLEDLLPGEAMVPSR